MANPCTFIVIAILLLTYSVDFGVIFVAQGEKDDTYLGSVQAAPRLRMYGEVLYIYDGKDNSVVPLITAMSSDVVTLRTRNRSTGEEIYTYYDNNTMQVGIGGECNRGVMTTIEQRVIKELFGFLTLHRLKAGQQLSRATGDKVVVRGVRCSVLTADGSALQTQLPNLKQLKWYVVEDISSELVHSDKSVRQIEFLFSEKSKLRRVLVSVAQLTVAVHQAELAPPPICTEFQPIRAMGGEQTQDNIVGILAEEPRPMAPEIIPIRIDANASSTAEKNQTQHVRMQPQQQQRQKTSPLYQNSQRRFTGHATTAGRAMPGFLIDFFSVIETSFVGDSGSYCVEEEYSAMREFSRAVIAEQQLDIATRRVDRYTIIDGRNQLVYQSTLRYIPLGMTPAIPSNVRDYFFSGSFTCSKTSFSKNVITSRVNNILLLGDQSAWYMGYATIRGRLTQYWQAANNETITQWFFAVSNHSELPGGTRELVRIAVSGRKGTLPPFFTHHLFYLQGVPFDSKYSESACQFFSSKFGCSEMNHGNSEGVWTILYDFYGYTPLPAMLNTYVEKGCRQTDLVNSYPPSKSCADTTNSSTTILVLCILFSGIGFTLGILVMWCRARKLMEYARGALSTTVHPRPQQSPATSY